MMMNKNNLQISIFTLFTFLSFFQNENPAKSLFLFTKTGTHKKIQSTLFTLLLFLLFILFLFLDVVIYFFLCAGFLVIYVCTFLLFCLRLFRTIHSFIHSLKNIENKQTTNRIQRIKYLNKFLYERNKKVNVFERAFRFICHE